MIFGSVLEHFPNIRHEKACKTFVQSWMHNFGVPNFRKNFYHECIQSDLLDPKQCLGVFLIILQNFTTKNQAKLVFRGWKHYFGVSNFRQKFSHEHLQSNLLDPKWCLEVFRSIWQWFIIKNNAKLVFWGWMHYFGLPNFRKKFAMNASNLTC